LIVRLVLGGDRQLARLRLNFRKLYTIQINIWNCMIGFGI